MQIIQFKCDKCGQVWDTSDKACPQQVNLSLTLNYGCNYPPSGYVYGTHARNHTWCRPCIEEHLPFPEPEAVKASQSYDPAQMLVECLEHLGFTRQQ